MTRLVGRRILLFAFATLGIVSGVPVRSAEPVFERDVLPIFAARCLSCHGGVTKKADLDLRNRASILRGGRKGPAIVPGDSSRSRLWSMIESDRMPREEPILAPSEKAIIRRWIDAGAPDAKSTRAAIPLANPKRSAFEVAAEIDRFIDKHLRESRRPKSAPADDADFLRRLHLDMIGRIPTADAVRTYLADSSPRKREAAVDRLLDDPLAARQLARLWHNAIVPLDLNRRIYNEWFLDWLTDRFAANEPLDKTVRSILIAEGDSRKNHALGFYVAHRRPTHMAKEATRIFLGVRLECAQCHDHPFAELTQADYWAMAAFFARMDIRRETKPAVGFIVAESSDPTFVAKTMVGGSFKIPGTAIKNVGTLVKPHFLNRESPELSATGPFRPVFADWVTSPKNPYFARATVNRIWAEFFGRGIVDPVDDLDGLDFPAVPGLLDFLAEDFVASGFDIRRLQRSIVSTEAYRRSSRPVPGNESDESGLSRRTVRMLSSEQLYDSLCATLDRREIDIEASPGSVSLGPDARTRFVNLLKAQLSETATSKYEHSVQQAVALMNSPALQLNADAARKLLNAERGAAAAIETLYLRTLSRMPTPRERERLEALIDRRGPDGYADALWAVMNSAEFLANR
jgi:hypothetical protein